MKDKKKLQLTAIAIVIAIASIFIYKSAVAPKLYDKYLNTGIKYLMDGQYEEAILAFDKAIKIEPKTTEARVYQAKAYVGNEELDKAVNVLEEAQNIDITNEELLKEILEILNDIDSDIAYEFLDRFIQEVGENNISQDIRDILETAYENPQYPTVDPEPGTYLSSIIVKIKQDKTRVGHSYYYTVDGSEPNKNSQKYVGQIKIDEATTIKLIGYNKNDESTEVATFNYIIDKEIINETKDSIEEAERLISNTNVGNEVGEISQDNRDKLQFIIDEAKGLTGKESASYKDVSNIKDKIENAIIEFEDNIIKPVDKSKLESAISQANNLYNNAVEGNQKGQYKSGSKSNLMSAINKAKKVYNSSSVKQDDINSAASTLNNAISSFKNKKITQSDRNADGTYTRSYVESYVKRKYPNHNIIVQDSSWDGTYNNEVCYFILAYDNVLTPGGYSRESAFFIGSKTLKQYSTFDVGF